MEAVDGELEAVAGFGLRRSWSFGGAPAKQTKGRSTSVRRGLEGGGSGAKQK